MVCDCFYVALDYEVIGFTAVKRIFLCSFLVMKTAQKILYVTRNGEKEIDSVSPITVFMK